MRESTPTSRLVRETAKSLEYRLKWGEDLGRLMSSRGVHVRTDGLSRAERKRIKRRALRRAQKR